MSFNPKLQNTILYDEKTLSDNFGIIKDSEASNQRKSLFKFLKP